MFCRWLYTEHRHDRAMESISGNKAHNVKFGGLGSTVVVEKLESPLSNGTDNGGFEKEAIWRIPSSISITSYAASARYYAQVLTVVRREAHVIGAQCSLFQETLMVRFGNTKSFRIVIANYLNTILHHRQTTTTKKNG